MRHHPPLEAELYRFLIYNEHHHLLALVLAMSDWDLFHSLGVDARNADIERLPPLPSDYTLWRFLEKRTSPGVLVLQRWEKHQLTPHQTPYWEITAE